MGCQIHLGDVLWSALKGLKMLLHICNSYLLDICSQTGAVPFEMKGVIDANFVDAISMVGSSMFAIQLNNRPKDINVVQRIFEV